MKRQWGDPYPPRKERAIIALLGDPPARQQWTDIHMGLFDCVHEDFLNEMEGCVDDLVEAYDPLVPDAASMYCAGGEI